MDTTTLFQQALATARRNRPYAQDARHAAREALRREAHIGQASFFAALDALGGQEAVLERLVTALEREPDPYDHLAVMAASTFAYTGRKQMRTEIRYQDAADWCWEEDASALLASMGIPLVERREVVQKEITQTFPDGHRVTAWERQDSAETRNEA